MILDRVYGYGDWFSLLFGFIAVMFIVASLTSARFVGNFGLHVWMRHISSATLALAAVLVALAVLTDGTPPFWVLFVAFCAFIPAVHALIPNCNTASLMPLSHVAGTASAVTGTVSTAGGALIGNGLSAAFDGTVRPYVFGSALCVVVAFGLIRLGGRLSRQVRTPDR